jgi:hypothetical protein
VQVEAIGADIAEAKATIDTLPALVEDVQASVDRTRDRLALDRWLIRLLIASLLAAVLAAASTADRGLLAIAEGRWVRADAPSTPAPAPASVDDASSS